VTDGQTDGQTDGRAIAYSALSMLSRANKNNGRLALGALEPLGSGGTGHARHEGGLKAAHKNITK